MKLLGRFKTEILNLATWSQKNLERLIILIGVCVMAFILLVLLSWAVGYYANGFFGFKFELGSIWQGLGACVAAITGLLTVAGVNLGRQYIDAKFNSPPGQAPARPPKPPEKGA
ncbi:MAG: hypothetical protein IJS96_03350 [Schwartzia sp.]|nr:hypothetical protein [Schwartzia sp. (in: firmicutes)]